MYWRSRLALAAPFWLWLIMASGTKDHLRRTVSLRTLSEMVQYPTEALDRKSRYIQDQARAILNEAVQGDY